MRLAEQSLPAGSTRAGRTPISAWIAGLTAALILIVLVCLCLGQYSMSVGETLHIMTAKAAGAEPDWKPMKENIIFFLRLPRIISAGLVGASLALSGSVYQGIFRNPLVSPDLLGVSSGACVGAALSILLNWDPVTTQFMAFGCGLLAVGLTLTIPRLLGTSTNEEIDRLRLSATCSLLERRDVIVVSSVSCIYGLGEPDDFARMMISLRPGQTMERDELLRRLVEDRYERNDVAFQRNMFRVRGDTVELYPAYYKDRAVRVEFFGDEIDRITEFHPVTGQAIRTLNHIAVYPASHYVTPKDKMDAAMGEIRREMEEQVKFFQEHDKLIEAQRIRQRTEYDMEMMTELGYCSGIENYSRIISQRPAGSPPMTLLDFFPDDFVLFVDESHVTLPQVRAMYNGDHARKQSLVDYGFRLPCAFDNRPLR
ncbi:MAG: iron chelate uptake ABC transporter family permease subunit, partial [Eubacterium sp.]|nr:iron chelate uptake ABC transporter family permease subunit [Eubacterium sp.]